jgi:hypothetical protein
MADGLERVSNRYPAFFLSPDLKPTSVTLGDQLLLISIARQSLNLTVTTQDQTGQIVGELNATDEIVCNGANYQLRRITCPTEQPGIGFLLLASLREIAMRKGGTVFYSDIDDATRQWLIGNGLANLLETPVSLNT